MNDRYTLLQLFSPHKVTTINNAYDRQHLTHSSESRQSSSARRMLLHILNFTIVTLQTARLEDLHYISKSYKASSNAPSDSIPHDIHAGKSKIVHRWMFHAGYKLRPPLSVADKVRPLEKTSCHQVPVYRKLSLSLWRHDQEEADCRCYCH